MATLPRDNRPPRNLRTASHDPAEGGPRQATILAGGVAVLLLLGAGAWTLRAGSGARPTPSVPKASSVPAFAPIHPAPGAAASPGVDGSEPLLRAPQVSWQLFSGVALPYSPQAQKEASACEAPLPPRQCLR